MRFVVDAERNEITVLERGVVQVTFTLVDNGLGYDVHVKGESPDEMPSFTCHSFASAFEVIYGMAMSGEVERDPMDDGLRDTADLLQSFINDMRGVTT